MDNLKPFDVREIEESLSRVVSHGGTTYLLFPYVSALKSIPQYDSVAVTIKGSAATVEEFSKLAARVAAAAVNDAEWFISFSTPWLIPGAEVQDLRARGSLRQRQ